MTKLSLAKTVISGDQYNKLMEFAKLNNLAIPAINVTTSSTINACLEGAKNANSPIIIQFSHGGAQFMAGKSVDNTNHQASIHGAIVGAKMIHDLADLYKTSVIIHTDHCAKKLLPWIDGLLEAGEEFFKINGKPLFSSHMLDLSTESLSDNIEICKKYLTRMSVMNMHLEIELGITGGEEDGVDNDGIDNKLMYTQPSDVAFAYQELSKISSNFTIAASFGNVHGVYKPGNVKLEPVILKNSQDFIHNQFTTESSKPVNFVFHGGSGSDKEKIHEAIQYGVVKMNLDTDFQWAYWLGVKNYSDQNKEYLEAQLGNPSGNDQPNKKFYDPRAWLRCGEQEIVKRLIQAYNDLNSTDILD
jgi:fructose-bisphosphate aldolase, class II